MNELTLEGIRAYYAGGGTPRKLWKQFRERLDEYRDEALFIALADEVVLEPLFHRLDDPETKNLPLYGVPFAIKDNIDWDGLPTTAACPAFSYHPTRSAAVVEKLIAAGGIPVGKTNLDQFATGLVGTRSPYGTPRNALIPGRIPGGSSAGSASAVAAGLVAFSLGTDTAGSGRIPAAFQELVGYKPTRGLVSTRGVVPACRTLDCVSVFAHSVSDARAVGAVIAGFDAEDAYSRVVAVSRTTRPARPEIGVPLPSQREFFGNKDFAAAYETAMGEWSEWADIVELDLAAVLETGRLLYQGPWVAERLSAVGDLWLTPEALWPVTRHILQGAEGQSSVAAFEAGYRLEALRRQAAPIWSLCDLLMLPTAPFLPTLDEVEADPLGINSRLGTWTNFVNLLDWAALALPAGRAGGLPFGITLMGPAGSDQALCEYGAVWESRGTVPAAMLGRTVIAVAGAHLRGLPLNYQLVERGARFIDEAVTAPEYRLYAFQDGPVAKPGMVREPGGISVPVELWDLPEAAWGSFMALIPSPLGLGKLKLADGRSVTGFLMEAEHRSQCTDITAFGSWRDYIASRR